MPHLPSLPDPAHLTDLLARYPAHVPALMAFTNQVMRDSGALTRAERELIAAYVSGLNACQFCHGSHRLYAQVLGIDSAVIDALMADPATAPVDAKLKPLLAYAAKLNTLPSRLIPADAQAVLNAGWPEAALFECIEVTALFNFYNRLIEGAGVNFAYESTEGHTAFSDGADMDNSYSSYADRVLAEAERQ